MYIITYDISKDRIRNKVCKLLKDYGNRIQYSVFETDLSYEETEKLVKVIKEMIDVDTDSVIFYFGCASCEAKCIRLGKLKKQEYLSGIVV